MRNIKTIFKEELKMAKNVKENVEEEVKNTEVSENTEEVKEGFLTKAKAKAKIKGINPKTAGKVVLFGAIAGIIGYAAGKKSSGSDEDYYDSDDFTTYSNSNDKVIDITEF